MRAAIYARVSSAAQRDAHTIESQLRVLRAFVAGQGWELVDTYVDDGRSAKTGMLERRDGFARLMRDAEAKRFELLVVLDVNRLTRTGSIEERAEILGPFQRLGIQIATPSTGIQDLRSFLGEFWVTVQALVAAEENRKRAAAIKSGKLRAIAEGRKPAGPTPFGLAYSRATGQWSIDEEAAAIVREIHHRVAGGESCVQIAADLAIRDAVGPRSGWARKGWVGVGVYRIARARHLLGSWCPDKERGAAIAVPAILTEAEWNASQAALISHGKRGLRRTKHIYLLEGIAVCGECGAPISIRSATRNPNRTNGNPSPSAYVCRARKLDRACRAPITQTADLDARVWKNLCDELQEPGLVEALAAVDARHDDTARDWAADAAGYRAHLERLQRHEIEMMGRSRRGLVSGGALDVELGNIARERKMVRKQLEFVEGQLAAAVDERTRLRCASEAVAELRVAFDHADLEDQSALLRKLLGSRKVVVLNRRARLDLRLPRAATATSRVEDGAGAIVQGSTAGYRTEHEKISRAGLRLRLVA